MDGDGDPVQIEISKTSRLGKAWYRFLEMMGFRRHVLGGFGRVRSGNCPFLLRCQVTVPALGLTHGVGPASNILVRFSSLVDGKASSLASLFLSVYSSSATGE